MTNVGTDEHLELLVVDDDRSFADLTATYLERHGENVTTGIETDPAVALDRIEAEPVDAVVSDYQMPGMDGIAFLEAVRAEYPNLPFVLFTGRGSEEVATEAIDAGVTNYVQKGGTEAYDLLWNRVENAVQQHRAERRARIASDRLIRFYEATDGFYTVDGDWTITYWNQTVAERTGVAVEDALGSDLWEVLDDLEGSTFYQRCHEVMAERTPAEFQTYYSPGDWWINARVYPLEEGLAITTRDITLEKERERELYERNERLEAFASTVSHDLRNPLQAAESHLEHALETGDETHVRKAQDANARIAELVEELLNLARGQKETFDATEIRLSTAAKLAWEATAGPDATLRLDGDQTILADDRRVQRLFENLYVNAIDHAGAAVTVTVGTLDDGFFVADDGPGIDPEERESVFEPGITTRDDGTGFGLAIVAQIVDAHDWAVEITESEAGGARFEITGVDTVETAA